MGGDFRVLMVRGGLPKVLRAEGEGHGGGA